MGQKLKDPTFSLYRNCAYGFAYGKTSRIQERVRCTSHSSSSTARSNREWLLPCWASSRLIIRCHNKRLSQISPHAAFDLSLPLSLPPAPNSPFFCSGLSHEDIWNHWKRGSLAAARVGNLNNHPVSSSHTTFMI